MFDIVRRRKYNERRVLIDSARVLDPQFDDSLICLSGAELELLRNVCLYLRRQDTFVATYFEQHYLTPDRDAWDALQAIVAGLEEKIMGCAELEGYLEDIRDSASVLETLVTKIPGLGIPTSISQGDQITASDTDETLTIGPVDAGEIWCIDKLLAYDRDNMPTYIMMTIYAQGTYRTLKYSPAPAAYELVETDGPFWLFPAEAVRVRWYGHTVGDKLIWTMVGRKFVLPS